MKKTISTILALTMLITPIIGSKCFANEPKGNARESYVQEPERSEQYRFHKSTGSKVPKFAGCVAAGAAAMVGTTVAGLKIFEDLLPERVKEWLPAWFKKDNAQRIESNNLPANTINESTCKEIMLYDVNDTKPANQIDNTKLDERAASLGEAMHDPVAPTIEKSKQVEPHESAKGTGVLDNTYTNALDNNTLNQHNQTGTQATPSINGNRNALQLESNNPPANTSISESTCKEIMLYDVNDTKPANQIDNIKLDEKAVSLGEVMDDQSVAPTTEEPERVELHESAKDASAWVGRLDDALDNKSSVLNQQNMLQTPSINDNRNALQPMCTEMPGISNKTTERNSSIDYKCNLDQEEMNDTSCLSCIDERGNGTDSLSNANELIKDEKSLFVKLGMGLLSGVCIVTIIMTGVTIVYDVLYRI